jgi:hypothetical protein
MTNVPCGRWLQSRSLPRGIEGLPRHDKREFLYKGFVYSALEVLAMINQRFKRNVFRAVGVLIIGFAFGMRTAWAQDETELTLHLSKVLGYAWAGDIQGTFILKASGPQDLERVVFFLDGEILGEDDEAPFQIQFTTDNYDLGLHVLSAVGDTSSGWELHSNEIKANFVDASQGWQMGLKLFLPALVVVGVAMLLSVLLPTVLGRGRRVNLPPGAPRSYGVLGGAICPKCHRPFGLHWWGMNLGVGKLDRCPYCGRWSVVRRASREALAAAEAAELETVSAVEVTALSEEERLRRDLEASRFEDE